jgi:hypothetical protein
MVVVPLKMPVGLAFTVTTALPVRSAASAVHLLSLTAVRVYVLVELGASVKV